MERNDLVRQAQSGDTEAFALLYKEVYQDLYRFALYILKNPADAEDVVSETVVNAFATIHKLRSVQAFRAWMFKILTNVSSKKLKEYSNKTVDLDAVAESIVPTANPEEDVITRQAFYELEYVERTIIGLHIFGGYTSREIAKALKMNENTVRSKERRALEKLAKKLR